MLRHAIILGSLLGALTPLSTYAQVSNGDFESWSGSTPSGWSTLDSGIAVSQCEEARNDAAYDFQGNRNPFIDHPELVNAIWGN